MKLGSSMSCARLTDRHNLPAEECRESSLQSANYSMPQEFLAIFRRADSAHPAEHPCEVLLRFEAAGHRDVQDTRLGRAQHLLRTLDPMTQDKTMRTLAG